MAYNPGEQYFGQQSRFSAMDATGGRGNWQQYMSGDGSRVQSALSQIGGTKEPGVQSSNELEEKVLAQQAEATPLQQWEQGLGRNMNQMNTSMQLGFQGLNATQQYQQAKEIAEMQKSMAQSSATAGMIQSGIGMVGGLFGNFSSGGSAGSPMPNHSATAFSPNFGSSFGGNFSSTYRPGGSTLF